MYNPKKICVIIIALTASSQLHALGVTEKYSAAEKWLSNSVVTGDVSVVEAAAYIISVECRILDDEMLAALRKSVDVITNFASDPAIKNGWDNDGWESICFAGERLKQMSVDMPVLSNAWPICKEINGFYLGTNLHTMNAIAYQENPTNDICQLLPESYLTNMIHRGIGELRRSKTSLQDALYVIEYYWQKILREKTEFSALDFSRFAFVSTDDTIGVINLFVEDGDGMGYFKFPESGNSVFHDTCFALIIRNGYLGNGYVNHRSFPCSFCSRMEKQHLEKSDEHADGNRSYKDVREIGSEHEDYDIWGVKRMTTTNLTGRIKVKPEENQEEENQGQTRE